MCCPLLESLRPVVLDDPLVDELALDALLLLELVLESESVSESDSLLFELSDEASLSIVNQLTTQ